jgi:hypothetical protein
MLVGPGKRILGGWSDGIAFDREMELIEEARQKAFFRTDY